MAIKLICLTAECHGAYTVVIPMVDTHSVTVLVVEDERDLADMYALWLDERYTVKTAYDGQSALEQIDETVDVVLLDRRMPGLTGDDVLESIHDRGLDCRVAMLTAIEPDFDIVEMDFDAYVVKPIEKRDLTSLIENLLARDQYEAHVQEYYSLASKKALLHAETTESERAESEEYARLEAQLHRLKEQAGASLERVLECGDYAEIADLSRGNTHEEIRPMN